MKTRFRVHSRRAVYLLNRLTRAGVSLDRIDRREERITFRTSVAEGRIAARLLTEEGVEYETYGFCGGRDLLRRLFSRPFLIFSVVVTLVSVLFFGNFVYDVSIRGNRYVNTSAIQSILIENRVDGFTAKRELDLPRIKREIVALDGVSFASVKVVGTRLDVEVKESLPSTSPDEVGYLPILASHSAIVTRVVAESGTPRVSSGDRVEQGALLIEPIYAFTEGGATAPARGEVWGVVTHVKEIVLPEVTLEPALSGAVTTTRVLRFLGKPLFAEQVPTYEVYDLEERLIDLGFGVSILERTYSEIASRALCHDFDLEGEAVIRRAAEELLLSIPCDAVPRGAIRVTQKRVDNLLYTVLYYTTEQRIDSLSLVP